MKRIVLVASLAAALALAACGGDKSDKPTEKGVVAERGAATIEDGPQTDAEAPPIAALDCFGINLDAAQTALGITNATAGMVDGAMACEIRTDTGVALATIEIWDEASAKAAGAEGLDFWLNDERASNLALGPLEAFNVGEVPAESIGWGPMNSTRGSVIVRSAERVAVMNFLGPTREQAKAFAQATAKAVLSPAATEPEPELAEPESAD